METDNTQERKQNEDGIQNLSTGSELLRNLLEAKSISTQPQALKDPTNDVLKFLKDDVSQWRHLAEGRYIELVTKARMMDALRATNRDMKKRMETLEAVNHSLEARLRQAEAARNEAERELASLKDFVFRERMDEGQLEAIDEQVGCTENLIMIGQTVVYLTTLASGQS